MKATQAPALRLRATEFVATERQCDSNIKQLRHVSLHGKNMFYNNKLDF